MQLTIKISFSASTLRTTIIQYHHVSDRMRIGEIRRQEIDSYVPEEMTALDLLELFGDGAWVTTT